MTSKNRRWGDAKPMMDVIFINTKTGEVVFAIQTGFVAYITERTVGYVAENGVVKSMAFNAAEHLEVRQTA